jgi:hypothetical protein
VIAPSEITKSNQFEKRSRNVLHHVWLNTQGETRLFIRRGSHLKAMDWCRIACRCDGRSRVKCENPTVPIGLPHPRRIAVEQLPQLARSCRACGRKQRRRFLTSPVPDWTAEAEVRLALQPPRRRVEVAIYRDDQRATAHRPERDRREQLGASTRCAGKPGHRGRDRRFSARDSRHVYFVTTTKRHFGERASRHLSRVISMSDSTDSSSNRSNAWTADQHLVVPARALSEDEYELLQEWMAASSPPVTAYVSRRATDSSALQGRIIIVDGKTRRPLYLIYSPLDAISWTVASVMEQAEVGEFPTLYAALSFVRPVHILHPIAALKK